MNNKLRITGECLLLAITSLISISIFSYATQQILGESQYTIFLAISIGQLLGLGALGTAYTYTIYENPLQKIQFNFNKKHILYIIGVTILVLLYNLGSNYISNILEIQTAQNTIQPYLQSQETILVFIAVSLLIVGPLEEYFYRGILQERFKDYFTPIHSILLTSLIFSVTHITSMIGSDPSGYILYLITLFLGAITFGYSYEKTENLAVPMIAHGLYNGILAFSLLGTVGVLS